MASADTTGLTVEQREPGGSRAARRLRREGKVLGIVYGGGEEPVAFQVDARVLRQALAAHSSVTVQFNPEQVTHQAIAAAIRRLATRRPPVEEPGRLHRIPVVYDGADLEMVCSQLQISPARLVELHCRPIYRAFLVGFVPGWAYLGPVPDELVLPRRAVPRTQVPAGAVAIAGQQTGIYPLASPGGWHLIGRTSVRLFLPDSEPPSLFRVGDRVKFFAAQA